MGRVRRTSLVTQTRRIDVRWASFEGRWIASADASDGPTLGLGRTARDALTEALQPFDGSPGDVDVITDDAGDGAT
jgi:hypothetical protein